MLFARFPNQIFCVKLTVGYFSYHDASIIHVFASVITQGPGYVSFARVPNPTPRISPSALSGASGELTLKIFVYLRRIGPAHWRARTH